MGISSTQIQVFFLNKDSYLIAGTEKETSTQRWPLGTQTVRAHYSEKGLIQTRIWTKKHHLRYSSQCTHLHWGRK